MTDQDSNVWGWLVPAHPKISVKPISLVNDKIFSVGRESICSFVLQDWMFQGDTTYCVDQISRLHFEIFRQDEKTLIVEKSSNGTFVQGKKLIKDTPKVLEHGDMVAILYRNVELFWYLKEETMIYTNHFPAKIITKYLVGNEVGRGTFGFVRKGFLKSSLQSVAFKFLSKSAIKFIDSDLSTEVEILKQLDHPAVIKLMDVVDDANNYIIVMEFAEGGDLERQVIEDKYCDRLSEETAKIQVSYYR